MIYLSTLENHKVKPQKPQNNTLQRYKNRRSERDDIRELKQ